MNLLRQQLEERPTAERSPTQLGEAVGLSRVTIWRHLHESMSAADDDLELRSRIQSVALEMRSYGYRPITEELHRRGIIVNHKRVLRLLREDNLLCLRRQAFVRTTDSNHSLTIYPNLARGLVLSNINQLWVADITYIRLRREFVYLAVILDAYSRRCIGWALSRHIDTQLTLAALRMALHTHHSSGAAASFRSRRPVCGRGLRRALARTQDPDQHEPQRQPLRQCQSRTIHAHAQVRRDLPERLRNARRGIGLGPAFHRSSL